MKIKIRPKTTRPVLVAVHL